MHTDHVIMWFKVSDSRVQSFLKWLKWFHFRCIHTIWLYNHYNLTKSLCKLDKTTSNLPLSGRCEHADLAFMFAALAQSCPNGEWNGRKVQNDVFFQCRIYEFNIYLFLLRYKGPFFFKVGFNIVPLLKKCPDQPLFQFLNLNVGGRPTFIDFKCRCMGFKNK